MESRFGAKFAKSKYFKGGVPNANKHSSPMWSSVVRHYPILCNVSRWIIGKGTRWFWMDNWLGEIILGPQPVDATLSIADDDYRFTTLYSNTSTC